MDPARCWAALWSGPLRGSPATEGVRGVPPVRSHSGCNPRPRAAPIPVRLPTRRLVAAHRSLARCRAGPLHRVRWPAAVRIGLSRSESSLRTRPKIRRPASFKRSVTERSTSRATRSSVRSTTGSMDRTASKKTGNASRSRRTARRPVVRQRRLCDVGPDAARHTLQTRSVPWVCAGSGRRAGCRLVPPE